VERAFGMPADEGGDVEGQRKVGARVAEKLPGDGGARDAGFDFDSGLAEAVAGGEPRVGSSKDGVEEIDAELAQTNFNAGGELWGGVQRVNEVVLEVPADVFGVLWCQGIRERAGSSDAGTAFFFESDFDG
jgi:hypothetical protein